MQQILHLMIVFCLCLTSASWSVDNSFPLGPPRSNTSNTSFRDVLFQTSIMKSWRSDLCCETCRQIPCDSYMCFYTCRLTIALIYLIWCIVCIIKKSFYTLKNILVLIWYVLICPWEPPFKMPILHIFPFGFSTTYWAGAPYVLSLIEYIFLNRPLLHTIIITCCPKSYWVKQS